MLDKERLKILIDGILGVILLVAISVAVLMLIYAKYFITK